MKKNKNIYMTLSGEMIHHGHINLIQKAQKYGSLIIGLLTDSAITEIKSLPLLNWEQRKKILQNIKKSKPVYNYNALATNTIMNYTIFKVGDDYQKLLNKVFKEDAKIKNSVFFSKTIRSFYSDEEGEFGRYSFYADRYDYVRIANMMMKHWKNDTCVGKYLKTMYENRVDRQYDEYSKFKGNHRAAQTYGGQFLFDPIGIEDRPILMMDGFAGQQVEIDFNNNRIITIHSTDRHYDYYSFVYLAFGAYQ